MAGYLGHNPETKLRIGIDLIDEFTTSSGQASSGNFTLSQTVAEPNSLDISVGGVVQPTSAYSVSGTTLAFGAGLVAVGDIVTVRHAGEQTLYPTIDNNTVTNVKMADDSVDSAEIVAGAVDLAHLAADSVDGTKIADNAINSEHYTDGSIDNIHTNFQPGTTFKGDGSSASGKIIFNCEQNSHAVSIQAPAHSAGATYTLTLPTSDGAANEVLQTNGSGVLTWVPLGTILDGSPDTDHTANGPQTNTYASGYSSTIMDLVYMGSSSKWLEADSDATGTSINLLGIALEAKTDTQAMNVALPGSFVRDESWSWTPGVPLYMHTTDGSITATKPTGSGDVVRTVGFSVHAKYIFFNPSSDYMTLA